jgi:hypothetical protein
MAAPTNAADVKKSLANPNLLTLAATDLRRAQSSGATRTMNPNRPPASASSIGPARASRFWVSCNR